MRHTSVEGDEVARPELDRVVLRAHTQAPGVHEQLLDHAGLVRVGAASSSGKHVQLTDLHSRAIDLPLPQQPSVQHGPDT